MVYYAHKEWYGDGFGKACFRGREKFFIWRKQKKKLAMRKPKKKSWRGGLRKNLFIFSFQIRQQNKQKESTNFSFTPHLFLSPVMSIIDEYESLEVIGKGSFGTVRRVRHKDGQILVRKKLSILP